MTYRGQQLEQVETQLNTGRGKSYKNLKMRKDSAYQNVRKKSPRRRTLCSNSKTRTAVHLYKEVTKSGEICSAGILAVI